MSNAQHAAIEAAVQWCRRQQAAAQECIRKCAESCQCGHPQCSPENNRRWLLDAAAEELEIQLIAERGGGE